MQVLTWPNEILARVAEPVTVFNEELRSLAMNMLSTMTTHGGIGLAAPQVGHSIRMIVLEKCPENLVMVNPRIVEKSDRETSWAEACLSCPGKSVQVKRPKWVVVEWQDLDGATHRQRLSHLDARCVQHEIDHLDGKVIAP